MRNFQIPVDFPLEAQGREIGVPKDINLLQRIKG